MSKWNTAANDKYILDLARQAMGKLEITDSDYSANCETAYKFVTHIMPRVYRWVTSELTNSRTLAKVIECQLLGFDVANGERKDRFTTIQSVVSPTERCVDHLGIAGLRRSAAWTLCAAIHDVFISRRENESREDGEDNFFIAYDQAELKRTVQRF